MFLCKLKMLNYERIEVSEKKKKNVNKTSKSKVCDICHYWYFLDKGFKLQWDVANMCHNVLMSMNFKDIAHKLNPKC